MLTSHSRFQARLFGAFIMILTLASSQVCFAQATSVTIARVSGSVKVLTSGQVVTPQVGAQLSTPLKVETGADGSLRIEQASSTVDIGPNSVILLPGPSGTTEKIIQNLGRALYSVKPRKARTFSVETPYLVSVVKGTLFSVTIEDQATSVALLEGSVELVADDIAPVLLHPNETARRNARDRNIDVTRIDTKAPIAPPPQSQSVSPSSSISNSSAEPAPVTTDVATLSDLNEITAAQRQARNETPAPTPPITPNDDPTPSDPDDSPTTPGENPTPDPVPNAPTPDTPAPTPEPPPPSVDPTPTPPNVDPTPVPPTVPDRDDDDCGKKHCDSDDDHDHGGGNNK